MSTIAKKLFLWSIFTLTCGSTVSAESNLVKKPVPIAQDSICDTLESLEQVWVEQGVSVAIENGKLALTNKIEWAGRIATKPVRFDFSYDNFVIVDVADMTLRWSVILGFVNPSTGKHHDLFVQTDTDKKGVTRLNLSSTIQAMFPKLALGVPLQAEVQFCVCDNRGGKVMLNSIALETKKGTRKRGLTREFKVEKRYVEFPVRPGGTMMPMKFYRGDESIAIFVAEVVRPEEAAFWTFLDLNNYLGETVRMEIAILPDDLRDVFQFSDSLHDEETIYKEKHRPQYHFSAKRGWLNDVNGAYFHDGKYHLSFQHNPYGVNWGNMSRGHAISDDLVYWKEVATAIHPDENGQIFSGCAVVDGNNVSGLGKKEKPPILLYYTSAGGFFGSQDQPYDQALAYSIDGGKTFKKYDKNPIINHIVGNNRDLFVVWHKESCRWILILFLDAHGCYGVFTSDNLLDWTQVSELQMDDVDCPQLLQLPVNGDLNNKKWVFYGARGNYIVGTFDGTKFTKESPTKRLVPGGSKFVASMLFYGEPKGRNVTMAWMPIQATDMPFNQCLSLPIEPTLTHTEEEEYRIMMNPVDELKSLRGRKQEIPKSEVKPNQNPIENIKGDFFEIEAKILIKGNVKCFGFKIRGEDIRFQVSSDPMYVTAMDFTEMMPGSKKDQPVKIQIYVDRLSIEIFVNDGQYFLPVGRTFNPNNQSLEFYVESVGNDPDAACIINKMTIWDLKSIWE